MPTIHSCQRTSERSWPCSSTMLCIFCLSMLDCVFYVFVNSCEHLKIKNLRFIKHATYGQEKPSCDAWITEGSWDTAVGEKSLWLPLPCRMGDLSGFFLGTWSWTGSWSWLVHAESIPHGSEAPPQHRMAWGDFEEGQYRVFLNC